MTRIDFYIGDDNQSSESLACRIVHRAYKSGLSVYVHTNSEDQSEILDKLLWVMQDTSFIPHGLLSNYNEANPIHIGHAGNTFESDITTDILINLADEVPLFFSYFNRLAEIIVPETKQAGRRRYRFYKDRGYVLATHNINN